MIARFSSIPACLLALAASVAQVHAEDFRYENERFGTTATFPRELFPDQLPSPRNGDGLGWNAPNGAEIFIYARPNEGNETPRSVIASRESIDDVTYEKSGGNWAVVSGYRDGRIFYERYIFRGELIHSVAIRYAEGDRKTYDPIIARTTNSLRGPSVPPQG